MDIFKFIEKLQKKPEFERKKILLIAVFAVMAVIIAVWLTTFRLNSIGASEAKTTGPFDFIKNDFKDFYGFLKTK